MRKSGFRVRAGAFVGRGPSAIALVAILGVLLACEASARDPWDRFLQNPDAGSFAELSQMVDGSQCDWGSPKNKEMVPDNVRGPLFDLIANGNESAFLIGLSTLPCFDGGDLEDFYQSSGRFMEQHPRRFLADVTEQGVPSRKVGSMAASVPTNDDPDSALKKVAERVALLREIEDEGTAEAQAAGLRALGESEQILQQMKANPPGVQ